MKTAQNLYNEKLTCSELYLIKGGLNDGGPVDLNDEDIDMPDL